MIDNELIQRNIECVGNCWRQAKVMRQSLYILQTVFTEHALEKLRTYIENPSVPWTPVEMQENLPRSKITWDPDTVIEELHMVCQGLDTLVARFFSADLNFHGLQIWQDTEGYQSIPHKDRDIIDLAMQVYLFDAPVECGTTFVFDGDGDSEVHYEVPHLHNTGYLNLNSRYSILHYTTTPVPVGIKRYSLYAYWSRKVKQ